MANTKFRPYPVLSEDQKARFWRNVSIGDADSCWMWTGCVDRVGYGIAHFNLRSWRAHRIALILSLGFDIGNLVAMHICDNPGCCNPAHLKAGTSKENSRDMVIKGRGYQGEKHWTVRRNEDVPRGSHSHVSKFTDDQVRQMKQMLRDGVPRKEISAIFGIKLTNLQSIVSGHTWRHVTI